ncbi:TesB Acyl-CoA thioesterase [Acidimicrobiia bacterium]
MTRFDLDTQPEALDDNTYRVRIDDGWWVGTGPNGGYLAALMVRTFEAAVNDPARTCRSVTAHYLSRPEPGDAIVEVTVERSGRSMTSLSARLTQNGRVLLTALAAFSAPRSGPAFSDLVMPEVAMPEVLSDPVFDDRMPERAIPEMAKRYQQRWAIGSRPFSGGTRALVGGWIRLAEPQPVDAAVLAAFVDAWMPAMFSRISGPWGITTVDLTVHVRSLPPAGYDDWCLVQFGSVESSDGFCEEDGAIWTRDGQLLAQSRQLAAILGMAGDQPRL